MFPAEGAESDSYRSSQKAQNSKLMPHMLAQMPTGHLSCVLRRPATEKCLAGILRFLRENNPTLITKRNAIFVRSAAKKYQV